jgi:glucose-1-phosphate adenylyltransferase
MDKKAARFVSRLTHQTLAIVLAGGRGSRLKMLTDWRTKPAVPFGGKFRIIDFTLSNCLNSNIRKICVLTQYKSHSLIQHILQGWNRFDAEYGEFIDIIPAQQWRDEENWYQGTADAVYQSLDIIESHAPEYVLILAGDHVYNMDYGEMLAAHVETGADFTIACNKVPKREACAFGVMQVNSDNRIISFTEKPENPATVPDCPDISLVSMGIYVFSRKYMRELLLAEANDKDTSHDFGKDVIPKALRNGAHVQAYSFTNPARGHPHYWRDVGTIDAYYQANKELLSAQPPLDIYDATWPVITYQQQLPPAHFIGNGANFHVESSMVSGGCSIEESWLEDSILYSNVKVGRGCELRGVLALPGCEIGEGSRLRNVILDNHCKVPANRVIDADNIKAEAGNFHRTADGIVVVDRKSLGQDIQYIPGVSAKKE